MAAEKAKEKESKEVAPYRGGRFMDVFDEMDRMFGRMMGRGVMPSWLPRLRWSTDELQMAYPDVDIFETDNEIVLKADLPGVKKEDLSIDVSEDVISISGERKKEEKVETKDYCRCERSYGSFRRSFALPSGADVEKVKASFKDGVLEVKVPKKAIARKKKVEITE